MQHLTDVVIQRYSEGYYPALKDVVDNATAEISFFGSRYITAKKYRGSFPIETLVIHLRDVIITKDFNIKQKDRPIGREISARITQLYEESNEKLKSAFKITQLLCWLREAAPFNLHNTQGYWDWDQYRWFDCYTETQYQLKFKQTPTQKSDQHCSDDSYRCAVWWIEV